MSYIKFGIEIMNAMVRSALRTAVFMDRLPPGSSAKVAGQEVRQLNELGFDSELLLIKREVSGPDREHLNAVTTASLEDSIPRPLRLGMQIPGFSFFSSFHLTAPIYGPLTLKKKYDLIVAHGTYTCFTAYSLKKIRRIPYVAFLWDPIAYILQKVYNDTALRTALPFLRPIGKVLDKIISDASEVVLLPSKFHLARMKDITNTAIEILYPGVDASEALPKTRGDYILAVARWERGKKPFFYLDLLEALRREKLTSQLVMVGPWKDSLLLNRFLKEAESRGLRGFLDLHGPPSNSELVELYRGAGLLVHAVTESFGMIGLEAAAHGCPFIIPKGSGVTDLFSDGVHGFFPSEGDTDAYAKAVSELFFDRRRTFEMGRKAWEVARQFTWRSHAEHLGKVLTSLS
jgi:glycosyltransferase involved in cell wall biosynthesis